MKITLAETESIAKLACLELSPSEKIKYAEQLSVILDNIGMLKEVDTENVPETCQVTGLLDVTREDAVKDCPEDARRKLLAQFPEKRENLLKVRAVFKEEFKEE